MIPLLSNGGLCTRKTLSRLVLLIYDPSTTAMLWLCAGRLSQTSLRSSADSPNINEATCGYCWVLTARGARGKHSAGILAALLCAGLTRATEIISSVLQGEVDIVAPRRFGKALNAAPPRDYEQVVQQMFSHRADAEAPGPLVVH